MDAEELIDSIRSRSVSAGAPALRTLLASLLGEGTRCHDDSRPANAFTSIVGNAHTPLDVRISSPDSVGPGLDCIQTVVVSKFARCRSSLAPLRHQHYRQRSCGLPLAGSAKTRI